MYTTHPIYQVVPESVDRATCFPEELTSRASSAFQTPVIWLILDYGLPVTGTNTNEIGGLVAGKVQVRSSCPRRILETICWCNVQTIVYETYKKKINIIFRGIKI